VFCTWGIPVLVAAFWLLIKQYHPARGLASSYEPKDLRKAFLASHILVFVWHESSRQFFWYNDAAHFLIEKHNRSYYFKKVKEIWTVSRKHSWSGLPLSMDI